MALKLNYVRATQISVILGKIFAILFAILALWQRHWMLLLVAVFIYVSASNEIRCVRYEEQRKRTDE
ncbi:MAG: hypothetical protein A3C47_04160 [Omnitrophica bacterium RIFCSPHIGHO2_02_FULL_51_18]|nr:MAG: hypothetical protein A3C47_04160 [Omnitrophica bacterium RIFCSPHIGHO2_02_FULL_51_18]